MKIFGAIIGTILAVFILGAVGAAIVAWPVMVGLGILASWTGWPVALGFKVVWLIVLLVRLTVADFKVEVS